MCCCVKSLEKVLLHFPPSRDRLKDLFLRQRIVPVCRVAAVSRSGSRLQFLFQSRFKVPVPRCAKLSPTPQSCEVALSRLWSSKERNKEVLQGVNLGSLKTATETTTTSLAPHLQNIFCSNFTILSSEILHICVFQTGQIYTDFRI